MKHSEVIKEIRAAAKKVGLTFKKDGWLGSTLYYKFTIRYSDTIIIADQTLEDAYNNVCSGFVGAWNGKDFY